jgi:DNA-binding HxlR family transcriptional regulator
VTEFRYAQFCPLARATELLGERWTLLVVRDLLTALRFSDLRSRLRGISSSVLAARLERLEARGLVAQRELPAPAASVVYELTEAGRALRPVIVELARWGLRFLLPPNPNDHTEPAWATLFAELFQVSDGGDPASPPNPHLQQGET